MRNPRAIGYITKTLHPSKEKSYLYSNFGAFWDENPLILADLTEKTEVQYDGVKYTLEREENDFYDYYVHGTYIGGAIGVSRDSTNSSFSKERFLVIECDPVISDIYKEDYSWDSHYDCWGEGRDYETELGFGGSALWTYFDDVNWGARTHDVWDYVRISWSG